jgi:hypothetical protein
VTPQSKNRLNCDLLAARQYLPGGLMLNVMEILCDPRRCPTAPSRNISFGRCIDRLK